MSQSHELRLPSGLHITATVQNDHEWRQIEAHFNAYQATINLGARRSDALWECPLCCTDMKYKSAAPADQDIYTTTYFSKCQHDVWMTHLVPERYESEDAVPDDERKIIIDLNS